MSNFFSFPQYYQYISSFRSQITYSFIKCDCSIYFFLDSTNLTCRGTDISKYFRESLRDRRVDCISTNRNTQVILSRARSSLLMWLIIFFSTSHILLVLQDPSTTIFTIVTGWHGFLRIMSLTCHCCSWVRLPACYGLAVDHPWSVVSSAYPGFLHYA